MKFNLYSSPRKNRPILFLSIAIFLTIGLLVSKYWHYFPFQEERYGREFNKERIGINQPIIEDYFIPKFENFTQRQVWYIPDSIKDSYCHVGKNYWVKNGNLSLEIDYYRYNLGFESVDWLTREYHFNNDSTVYTFEKISGKEVTLKRKFSQHQSDSLLTLWCTNR